jgi:hypothetical protein
MTSQTSQTSQTGQTGNELYFTKSTKRYARIGDTLRVVTEGATITITLGDITRVGVVVTEPGVVVNKSTRKRATATENTEPQAARKPAARKPAAAKVTRPAAAPAPAK